MSAYLWMLLIVLTVDIVGKAIVLKNGDFTRNPNHVVADLVFCVVLLAWTAVLLWGSK